MEELNWEYEIQGWHPDKCEDHHLLHVYARRDNNYVVFMTTIKVFWDSSYKVNNTFAIKKYKLLEKTFLSNVLERFDLKNR